MRDFRGKISSWFRLTAKTTKKPSSFNSFPRGQQGNRNSAPAPPARANPRTGRSNLELPRCAIRAGMTSLQLSGRETQRLGDPQGGLEWQRRIELRGLFWRNSIREFRSCSYNGAPRMMPVPECCRITTLAPAVRAPIEPACGGHGRMPDETAPPCGN